MASYFDDHDCEPLREGERPNHLLHLARLLFDVGLAFEDSFHSYFHGEKPPPPASLDVVQALPTITYTDNRIGPDKSCPVCLGEFKQDDKIKVMPCDHCFHDTCILPWLERTNSCPLCRHELATDDQMYEEYRKHKAQKGERDFRLESLHDSMFG